MKVRLLNTGSLLLFALIMLALLFNLLASGKYKTSNTEVMASTLQDDFIMDYASLAGFLENPTAQTAFIDLRDATSFSVGHVPGAINIPRAELLNDSQLKVLRAYDLIVVYADKEYQAVTAAMLLLGKGIEAVRILPGGFAEINKYVLEDGLDPAYRFYSDEKARFDYPRFMHATGAASSAGEQAKPTIPAAIKTEVVTVQGGC